jgi:PPOX class probable F420-dependent enzyme
MTSSPLTAAATERVNEAEIAWLTTLRPDGSPHTTPVWFVHIAGLIWVATGTQNTKVRNVAQDPRVSLAIDGTADAPLVAQGAAALIDTADAEPRVSAAFSAKYDGWDIHDTSVDGRRTLVKIDVSRWLLTG